MTAHAHLPGIRLAKHVYFYALIDDPIPEFRFLRSNALCFNLGGVELTADGNVLTGPVFACSRLSSAPLVVKPTGRIVFILLDQGAWSRLLGIDPATIDTTIVPLALDPGSTLDMVEAKLRRHSRDDLALVAALDRFFLDSLAKAEPEGLPERARSAIISDFATPMPEVAAGLGVSQRTLQRTFKRRYGLTPSRYAKVVRTLRSIAGSDYLDLRWSEVPPEIEYADQSHWIRDIRNLHGLTPSQLRGELDYPWLYYPRGSNDPNEATPVWNGLPSWREFGEASRLT